MSPGLEMVWGFLCWLEVSEGAAQVFNEEYKLSGTLSKFLEGSINSVGGPVSF